MATGRKTVVVGQTIDPDTWGNPVWDQSVQTFASAADRTTQFGAPKMGAVTWLDDVKVLQVWDGTTWQHVGPAPYAVLRRTSALPTTSGVVAMNTVFEDAATLRGFTYAAGVLTITRAGLYAVTFGGEFANQTAASRQGFVLLNGGTDPAAAVLSDKRAAQTGGLATGISVGGHTVRTFAGGDRLQLAFYQDSGPVLNVTGMSLSVVGVA